MRFIYNSSFIYSLLYFYFYYNFCLPDLWDKQLNQVTHARQGLPLSCISCLLETGSSELTQTGLELMILSYLLVLRLRTDTSMSCFNFLLKQK